MLGSGLGDRVDHGGSRVPVLTELGFRREEADVNREANKIILESDK